jgi:hypothetical protein
MVRASPARLPRPAGGGGEAAWSGGAVVGDGDRNGWRPLARCGDARRCAAARGCRHARPRCCPAVPPTTRARRGRTRRRGGGRPGARFASPRPGAAQSILGVAAWALALVAPSLLVILGAVRLVGGLDDLIGSRPRPRPAARVADRLPGDHVVVSRVRLPDGRLVPELVVGPFGVAVVEELPPKEATRQRGGRWEVRTAVAGWQPMESPIDRATRDAERVRRWLAHEDHDHVVRVYAAVVANEPLARSPECAVVTSQQLQAWVASLPPQRSLNQDRRDRIVELLEASLA